MTRITRPTGLLNIVLDWCPSTPRNRLLDFSKVPTKVLSFKMVEGQTRLIQSVEVCRPLRILLGIRQDIWAEDWRNLSDGIIRLRFASLSTFMLYAGQIILDIGLAGSTLGLV